MKVIMEIKKYKLTDETVKIGGRTLYRIEALDEFSDLWKGDKGGFVESERNLSQEGDCLVYDDACVYDGARVHGDARICGNSFITDNALVTDSVVISGNATIYGNARVRGNAHISDAYVLGNAVVSDATVSCTDFIRDYAMIYGDAKILCQQDYMVFKDRLDPNKHFTWTWSNNMWKFEHFYGTGEELVKRGYEMNDIVGHYYESCVKFINDNYQNKGRILKKKFL